MATLTKTQQDVLLVLRARLDVTHPAHRADPAALASALPYINTWVLPLLDALENGATPYTYPSKRDIETDAARVRELMQERKG